MGNKGVAVVNELRDRTLKDIDYLAWHWRQNDAEMTFLGNFGIDVVNGIVYLSGVASTPVEMNKVVTYAENLRFAEV